VFKEKGGAFSPIEKGRQGTYLFLPGVSYQNEADQWELDQGAEKGEKLASADDSRGLGLVLFALPEEEKGTQGGFPTADNDAGEHSKD